MRKLGVIAAILTLWNYGCTQRVQGSDVPVALAKSDTTAVAEVDFKKDIQPILQSHCTPCHFTGGKMYARMPFDNPQTLRDHPDGIFRRIKDPGEVKKLRAFLEQKTL